MTTWCCGSGFWWIDWAFDYRYESPGIRTTIIRIIGDSVHPHSHFPMATCFFSQRFRKSQNWIKGPSFLDDWVKNIGETHGKKTHFFPSIFLEICSLGLGPRPVGKRISGCELLFVARLDLPDLKSYNGWYDSMYIEFIERTFWQLTMKNIFELFLVQGAYSLLRIFSTLVVLRRERSFRCSCQWK